MKIDISKIQLSAALNRAAFRSGLVFLISSVLFVNLFACGTPPQPDTQESEATAQALVETRLAETAAAATATPSPTPAPSSTPTETFTPSPTPTETSTPTPTATPQGGGGQIIFSSNADGDFELFTLDFVSGAQTQLTNNERDDLEPAWSPDGSRVAYFSQSGDVAGIYIFETVTGEAVELHRFEVPDRQGAQSGGSPAWSKDGKVLFWEAGIGEPVWKTTKLYLTGNPGEEDFVPIDFNYDTRTSMQAVFSPEGNQIAAIFRVEEDRRSFIRGLDLAGHYLWSMPLQRNIRDLAWSPEGSRLAFSSTENGSFDIYVYHLGRATLQTVVEGPSQDRYPTWSPDGRQIVFASDRGGSWDLFALEINSGELEQLTDDPAADEIDPDWYRPAVETILEDPPDEAAGLYARVLELFEQGVIHSISGRYQTLPDYEGVVTVRNRYAWDNTDLETQNFVLRADVSWEAPSSGIAWENSGCGFVFRTQDNQNHYAALMGLDRSVYIFQVKENEIEDIRQLTYLFGIDKYLIVPEISRPAGNAELTLVVEDGSFSFLVDSTYIGSGSSWEFPDGYLALATFSGTNDPAGVACRMENIEVWALR